MPALVPFRSRPSPDTNFPHKDQKSASFQKTKTALFVVQKFTQPQATKTRNQFESPKSKNVYQTRKRTLFDRFFNCFHGPCNSWCQLWCPVDRALGLGRDVAGTKLGTKNHEIFVASFSATFCVLAFSKTWHTETRCLVRKKQRNWVI